MVFHGYKKVERNRKTVAHYVVIVRHGYDYHETVFQLYILHFKVLIK